MDEIKNTNLKISETIDVKNLENLRQFLGVCFLRSENKAWISQSQYIPQILKILGLFDCKPVLTPMRIGAVHNKEGSDESVDRSYYQEIIGCLLYIYTRTRPDKNFSCQYTFSILC